MVGVSVIVGVSVTVGVCVTTIVSVLVGVCVAVCVSELVGEAVSVGKGVAVGVCVLNASETENWVQGLRSQPSALHAITRTRYNPPGCSGSVRYFEAWVSHVRRSVPSCFSNMTR